MIEEFMLLANKSGWIYWQAKKTFIYRIHDEPNADKLVALQTVIAKFGYKIDLRSKDDISSHWIVYWVKSSVERTKFSGYFDYQNDE
jgi:exoribonuclease R